MSIHSCSGVTYLLRPIYYLKRRNKNVSILGIWKCECKSEIESEKPVRERERLKEKKRKDVRKQDKVKTTTQKGLFHYDNIAFATHIYAMEPNWSEIEYNTQHTTQHQMDIHQNGLRLQCLLCTPMFVYIHETGSFFFHLPSPSMLLVVIVITITDGDGNTVKFWWDDMDGSPIPSVPYLICGVYTRRHTKACSKWFK